MTAPAPDMSTTRKAALIVHVLLREGGDIDLAVMPDHLQERLTRELGRLGMTDKYTMEQVAAEFSDAISNIGISPPGSVEAALNSLEGRISNTAMARLRKETGGPIGDSWPDVLALNTEDMVPITESESPEVCAVLLSKLSTDRAAELLGMMPGERARRIAYAMSRTTNINEDAIRRIGSGLFQSYCGVTAPAFSDPAEDRVGAILNSTAARVREEVLAGLIEVDAPFGESVRKSIFTFADIPARVGEADVPKVIRDVEAGDLVRALASAQQSGGELAKASEFILGNLSTRMSESLAEEIAELGKVKQADGETAQTAVITSIRTMADAGTLILNSDDVEE